MNTFLSYLSVTSLMVTSLLLIFIILLQRGRGGGLAGAFGGAGGQSALGTKAGDVFTKITVGLAVFWVFLACLSIYALRVGSEGRIVLPDAPESSVTVPEDAPEVGGDNAPIVPDANGLGDSEAGSRIAPGATGEGADGPSLQPPAGDGPGQND